MRVSLSARGVALIPIFQALPGCRFDFTFFILIDSLVFSVGVVQRAFHEVQR